MIIKPYSEDMYDLWDRFVEQSLNGVFFHKRRFISYHKDRFIDTSLIIENEKGQVIGILPAAIDPNDTSIIISHPGITFGGLVSGNNCRGEKCILAMSEICKYFYASGYKSFRYKSIPYIYQRQPFQDDIYALFRLGATGYRTDINAVINIYNPGQMSKGRISEINKAAKSCMSFSSDPGYLGEIWEILEGNLLLKYGKKPVHTAAEIKSLLQRFPENILVHTAHLEGRLLAGVIFFVLNNSLHTQYITSSKIGQKYAATDYLISSAIKYAASRKMNYFDFGISNEDNGLYLNEGLYKYKRSYGAGSVVNEFYAIQLKGL